MKLISKCPVCNGKGKIIYNTQEREAGVRFDVLPCYDCKGTGFIK